MDEHFVGLSRRQRMTLLTALTFRGRDALSSFDHLPDEEADLLRESALAILTIPRDARVPLLVQEIKRLVMGSRGEVWASGPDWLARTLQRERRALVEVVLRALPNTTAQSVRKQLLGRSPPMRTAREPPPAILQVLKWKLEGALSRDVSAAGAEIFEFDEILFLTSREISTLCDRLGASVLAPALAGLSKPDRECFIGKMTAHQRRWVGHHLGIAATHPLSESEARGALARFGDDPRCWVRSAGARWLVECVGSQSPEFAAKLAERHRNELGELLQRWTQPEPRPLRWPASMGRQELAAELRRLAAEGLVDTPVRVARSSQGRQPANDTLRISARGDGSNGR